MSEGEWREMLRVAGEAISSESSEEGRKKLTARTNMDGTIERWQDNCLCMWSPVKPANLLAGAMAALGMHGICIILQLSSKLCMNCIATINPFQWPGAEEVKEHERAKEGESRKRGVGVARDKRSVHREKVQADEVEDIKMNRCTKGEDKAAENIGSVERRQDRG